MSRNALFHTVLGQITMGRLKRVVWIYVLAGFIWIFLSDWLVFQLGSDRIITLFQNIKGWLFVLASATLLYILLAREWRVNLRHAIEKEQREQDFTYLFQKHPHPMWIYDRQTLHFMEVNQKALTMYGYTREEWLMMRITDLRPAAEVPELLSVIQNEDRLPSVSGPWEHLKKDGSRIQVDILAHEIHHQGRAAVLVVAWDVTEREATRHKLKEAEAQQLENERLRLEIIKHKELRDQRARFLSVITHEFRNPLAAIQSSTTLLQQYYERLSPTRREKHYQTIYTQIQRLLELIDDITELRDFDALEFHFSPTKADIVALCKDVVEEGRLTAGDTTSIDFVCDIPQLEMILDVKLIRQAIGNLMSNAIKYSPMGGRITLALQTVGNDVFIGVRDQGIGIPLEDQKRLLSYFYRASNVGDIPGTGLGLAVAKQGVERHGGFLSVESTLGQGSVFTVRLPLSYVTLSGERDNINTLSTE